MKLVPILAVLAMSGACFAGTTTHHWFAKVPVSHGSGKSKNGPKAFKYKGSKGGKNQPAAKQSAILTTVHTN